MILNFIMCLLTFFFFDSIALAKGDLAIRSKKIELKLGSDKSDYEMSQKIFNMETGKAEKENPENWETN